MFVPQPSAPLSRIWERKEDRSLISVHPELLARDEREREERRELWS